MATLRDPLFGLDNAPDAQWQAADIEAARPSSLRGGWESGRIGSERNALGIDEAAALAAGDTARAQTLRAQNDALGQAQARVAPQIQKVEDINSVGTGLNWFGGQVGQGAASMLDPVAAATAVGGVGRVAGMLPGTAGKVGRAIGAVGGPLAAYGINQRQMAGEFANNAMQDPELMARTSPQDLYQTANVVGGVAGLADTVLPGIVGRQLTGAGLRAGIKGMGVVPKAGLELLGEGATELGQGEVGRYALGQLNPNRDTGGDNSDRLNEALGGIAGAGPFVGAGAMADAGYRRVGHTADQIGTKTGEVIDMAKGAYDGSALQGGVDKVVAAGKQKAGDMVDLLDKARGDDGKLSLTKMADLVEGARDSANELVQRYKISAEERDVLEGVPPADIAADPVKYDAWNAENTGKRMNFIAERLDQMAESDPKAAELFDRLSSEQDPVAQETVAQEASAHILAANELEQLVSQSERAASAAGEFAMKGAGTVGKGAVAVGKAAMKFGKAVFDGAAGEMRKKNAQGEDYAAKGYEAWLDRTGRAATERVVQGTKNSPAAAQAKRRGDLFGEMLATETRAAMAKRGYAGKRADNIAALMQDVGYDVAHLSNKGGPSGANAALTIARTADTLRTALGPRAEGVVNELQALADPKAAKMFDQLRVAVETSRTPYGQKQLQQMRTAAANQLMAILPTEDMQELLQSEAAGGKLTRNWLLETVEGLANGHESPQLRKALEQKFGETALNEMLAVVANDLPAPKLMKGTVNDGGAQGEAGVNDDGEYEAEQAPGSDFDKRQNEKKVEKGSGPKVYGFYRGAEQSLRGSTDRRDPFAPMTRASKGATPDRPALFKADTTLFDGTNALDKKIADMEAATEKTGHYVGKQSAYDVMKDLGFQPAKVLSVYRDYLMQDAAAKGLDPAVKSALLDKAARVSATVLDKMAQSGGQRDGFRTLAGERKQLMADAKEYFKERYVAVAEQLSDAVPDRVELTELLSMGRAGAKALEVSRKPGADTNAVLDEANLITFQSDLLKNKDRGLHIRADTLVNWVRAQRARNETKADGKEDNSNRAKNEAYLADLMEGITAVVDSGLVDEKLPTRINGQGEYESFAKGVPNSLRLVTSTYGAMEAGKKKRVEARGKIADPAGPDQEAVAKEQDRDSFTADPLEGTAAEPVASRAQGQTMTTEEEAQFAALNTAKERREFLNGLGLKQSGEQFSDARAADAKTSGDNATPLDFFPKQKPGAVPDEFADQQFRTTKKATDIATGPEPKMSAMAKAPERGAVITRTLRNDFASGVAMIESRLRSASRPELISDAKARETSAVGGQHYVMPLAHALNADVISKLDLGPAEAKQLMTLRAKTAKIILLADKLSDAQKITLTKAMEPGASADKVTLANYAKLLQAASAPAETKAPAPAPAASAAPATGLLAKTLSARLEYLNNPPDDYTTAKAREIQAWGQRQLDRITEAIKGVDESSEQYEALDEARFTARQLVKKAASVLEGDEHLIKEGFAEPEDTKTRTALELPALQATVGEGRYGVLDAAIAHVRKAGTDGTMTDAEMDAATQWAAGQAKALMKQMAGMGEGDHLDALETIYDDLVGILRYQLGVPKSEVSKRISAAREVANAGLPKSQPKLSGADWSDTGARKLSAMSTEIHNDLGRGGFAATHDSPIRHDGSFNWREHTGKGEGNAAFGAGTYLSTGDKVHAFYKKMMTEKAREEAYRNAPEIVRMQSELDALKNAHRSAGADDKPALLKQMHALNKQLVAAAEKLGTRSPTYHVSVGIMRAQMLNWDKPLSEQSSYVKKRLEEASEKFGLGLQFGSVEKPGAWERTSDSVWRSGKYVVEQEDHGYLLFADGKYVGAYSTLAAAKNGFADSAMTSGQEVYRKLAAKFSGSQAAASDYLQSLGILGHEYAASNGRDGKTPNYVIYDDSKIQTNYVHFNKQGGNSRVASQAEMDEAKAYVRKVLGPQVKVEFKDITGYSGEWLDAQQAIEISTTAAAGTLSTVYHEALHGFFSKFAKSDPRVLDTLKSLAENEKILGRVVALLAGHPAAIDQLKSGEERLAYIYQFWAAGQLDLPLGKARTLLQKLRKFFRRVLGLVTDSERAVALFEAFHGGQLAEPSAAGKVIARVLDEGTGVLKARRSIDGLTQWLAAKTMPAETVLATSESKAAQALAKEFFTNPGEEAAGKEAEGYLNARRRVAARYNNTFAQAIKGLSDRDMTQVSKYLQAEAELADIPYGPHREAVTKIRGLLQRFYKYMSDERGLELGHAGEKYFPRVWNTNLLNEKKDDFLKVLTTHYDAVLEQGAQGSKGKLSKEQVADRIWRALIDREGVNDKLDAQRQDGVLAPFFASKENRTLAWLQGEHAEPFLEKNLVATLSRYFHQGVRAAEYTDRFGADGEVLEAKLREVMGELTDLSHAKLKRQEFKDDTARAKWVSRQYRDVAEAVGAMEGTLGKDISPAWRKANSWMTVYQNVRLLPLSLFASFVDPLGMVARGATMKEAYDGFLRGMKEVVTTWGDLFREEPKERQADQWEKLAEHVGAVDAALFAHHVSDEYSSVYMERGAKTINDTMFKLNGMEAWNRGMRVAGVKSAVAFIERHAQGADKVHSKRWLEELGLDPKNIPLDADGKLITDKTVLMQQKGMGKSQAEREIDAVHYAINRWVEGAILTPNAAQRPAWGSDPHYSMFFHLKQFSYSFHQTILKRAVKEMNHGNLAPMGAFVWYIPTMIAADITKGLIQGGGELPAYMKGYDAGDWVMHGVQRAGLLGAGQLGVDAQADMFSLAGPGVEQAIDALRDPLANTTIKALPAHGLYAQALR